MHTYISPPTLHVLSIPSASVSVVIAVIRLLGYAQPHNRKIHLLLLWLASLVVSSGLLGVVCSIQIHDNEKHQKAFFSLLVTNWGLLMICEVNLLPHLEFPRLRKWVIIGISALAGLMIIEFCVSIAQRAGPSLILKNLVFSTFGVYFLQCIGLIYLFRELHGDLDDKVFQESPCYRERPWYRWNLLCHALLQLLKSTLAFAFSIKSLIDDGDLLFFVYIVFIISNICTLRIPLRPHARFSSYLATLYTRFFSHMINRDLTRFRTTSGVMEDQCGKENSLEAGEQHDFVASSGVPGVEDEPIRPFPKAVFDLNPYKLVCVYLSKVEPHKNILSTISLPNGSSVMVVLKSHISVLEEELGTICPPYKIEPSREDVDLLGSVCAAQNERIDQLSRMIVDTILIDSTIEKGPWIYAQPSYVMKVFKMWLASQSDEDSLLGEDTPVFSERVDLDMGIEAGRILSGGTFDFELYTLVRLSNHGKCTDKLTNLDKHTTLDEILSVEKLQDGSWELPVLKSYLPQLTDKVGEIFPGCKIESDYDPTEPSDEEVREFGYVKAKILRTVLVYDRAKRMKNGGWPRASAFYSQLLDVIRRRAEDGDWWYIST